MRERTPKPARWKKFSTAFDFIMIKNQFLVATDERFPITVALAHAFATGRLSPALVTLRKQELTDLVSEAAKTFGFQAKATLDSALHISLGLLSLSVASSTKGKVNPDQWADRLVAEGWKDLAKEAITLARGIKTSDEAYDYMFESDRDPRILRDHLRDFALRRDKHNQWMGYKVFADYRKSREHAQATDALVRWLIRSLVKRNLDWMKDPTEGPSCTDEALNTLLFRSATGLGFRQRDIILTPEEFASVRKHYDAAPISWMRQATERYQVVFDSIPSEIWSALDAKWLLHYLKKGPPKIKNWADDDLPGIIGVYYYRTYL
jgi:hypothetical protein